MTAANTLVGRIISEEAYAAGKMLDNSGWKGLLRNGITPSDIDQPTVPLCFDNKGAIIFAELSSDCADWKDESRGQRWLFESLIRHARHCAVLCKHSVTPEMHRHIDTLRGVDSFQVTVWDFGQDGDDFVFSPVYDGAYWQRFVTKWVNESNGPLQIRRHILGLSAGLVKPKAATVPPTEAS